MSAIKDRSTRRDATVSEVLVVVAVVAILAALLVPAIEKAREAAARAQSANNQKQIILACHQYAQANNGRLPWFNTGSLAVDDYAPAQSVFSAIRPYCEDQASVFVSPADPSLEPVYGLEGQLASYAANGQIFFEPTSLSTGFPDGHANTIGFAEHYALCHSYTFLRGATGFIGTYLAASFAAEKPWSVYPITSGNPPVSTSSAIEFFAEATWDTTFQVAPSLAACDPKFAQTPHPSGMIIAMMDGSVRTLAPSVSSATYWALITPAGREQLGSDW